MGGTSRSRPTATSVPRESVDEGRRDDDDLQKRTRQASTSHVLVLDGRTADTQRLLEFGTWEWRVAAARVSWSSFMFGLFGVSIDEFVPTHEGYLAMVHPDDRDAVEQAVTGALRAGSSYRVFHRLNATDLRWIEMRGTVTMGRDGSPMLVHGTARNVTADVALLDAARHRVDIEQAVFEHIDDLVIACDASGRVIALNRAMAAATGHDPLTAGEAPHYTEVLGYRTLDGEAVSDDDRPLARALRGEAVVDAEITFVNAHGADMTLVVSCRSFRDARGNLTGAIAIGRDVTEQRRAEMSLARAEEHDALTGLLHQPPFMSRLRAALARAQRRGWTTALIAIQLDPLRGHGMQVDSTIADDVIAEAARRVVHVLATHRRGLSRAESVARSGPGHFLVACERISGETVALALAGRLLAAIGDPLMEQEVHGAVLASAGVAVSRDPARTAEDLVDAAGLALARAREHGAGSIESLDDAFHSRSAELRAGAAALQRALAEGEFSLDYQPKIALSSGRATGVEALLRWNDPERGMVPPLDFIPLAEKTGMIKAVGAWVLRTACEDAHNWGASLPDFGDRVVAVNVSIQQLDEELAPLIEAVLSATGLASDRLCLEVTESAVMENAETAMGILRRIKALGVRLSIDDFGTGYSSLAHLRSFPIDELKIDRTFVEGLGKDPESTSIVAAIMGMAHALGISTVAEGVETELQENVLRNLGCDETQGYFRCRPQVAAKLEPILSELVHPAISAGRGANPSVVLIDEVAEVRQLVRATMMSAGFIVYEAEGGDEGLALVRRLVPDCVLLDVNLPNVSGLDVCRTLRSEPATAGTTVIMLTGDHRSCEKVAAYTAEADDYVVKPFTPRDLVARVNVAIQRRRGAVA